MIKMVTIHVNHKNMYLVAFLVSSRIKSFSTIDYVDYIINN